MSVKFPRRLWILRTPGSVAYQVCKDDEEFSTPYISLAEHEALIRKATIQVTTEQAQVIPAEAVPVASNSGVNGGRERADPPDSTPSKGVGLDRDFLLRQEQEARIKHQREQVTQTELQKVAYWKAKYIEARQSGYAEGLDEARYTPERINSELSAKTYRESPADSFAEQKLARIRKWASRFKYAVVGKGMDELRAILDDATDVSRPAYQPGELRCGHGPYKIQGTTGCQNCETGRVTLYYLKDLCSQCEHAAESSDVVAPKGSTNEP